MLQGDDGVTPAVQVPLPGMARERTELAWSRSGLSVAATVAVTLRRLWPLTGAKTAVTLVLIAVGATIWAVGMQLARRSSLVTHPGRRHSATSTFRLLTVGTLTLAAAGFVVSLVAPG